jgi:hypothetical protein
MLFVVMGVSLIVGLAMMWTLTQSKRQSDLGRRETDRLQFQTTMARMKHVLDAAQLCTCNLKGLLIANAAGPVTGWRVDLTPDIGERELFGFYRLDSTNTANMGCAAGGLPGNVTLDATRDVVFHLDSDGNYPGSLRGTRFGLNGFSFVADTGDPLVKRYRARATLAAIDDRGQGRSNIADPIDTDVYIEVADSRIRRCYQMAAPSAPTAIPWNDPLVCAPAPIAASVNSQPRSLVGKCSTIFDSPRKDGLPIATFGCVGWSTWDKWCQEQGYDEAYQTLQGPKAHPCAGNTNGKDVYSGGPAAFAGWRMNWNCNYATVAKIVCSKTCN